MMTTCNSALNHVVVSVSERAATRKAPQAGAVDGKSAPASRCRRRCSTQPIGFSTPRRNTLMQWKYLLSVIALIAVTSLSHAARNISNDDGGSPEIPEQSGELDSTSPDANPVVELVGQLAWETAHGNSANTG